MNTLPCLVLLAMLHPAVVTDVPYAAEVNERHFAMPLKSQIALLQEWQLVHRGIPGGQHTHPAAEQQDSHSMLTNSDSTYSVQPNAFNQQEQLENMKLEMVRIHQIQDRLQAENTDLKDEIGRWQVASSHVAEREAWARRMLSDVLSSTRTAPSAQSGTEGNSEEAQRVAVSDSKLAMQPALNPPALENILATTWLLLGTGAFWQLGVAFFTACALFFVAWQSRQFAQKLVEWRYRYPERDQSVVRATQPQRPAAKRRSCMDGLTRVFGRSSYRIQISEIHLGRLLADGDVHVALRDPKGTWMKTQVVRQSDGSFVKFKDVFTCDVTKQDDACLFAVFSGETRTAYLQLPARDLVNLSQRRHQQFYRTELVADPPIAKSGPGDVLARKPYAAMRIRDITTDNMEDRPSPTEELEEGSLEEQTNN